MVFFALFSCSSFKIVDDHVNKKMTSASLKLNKKVINGDTIEYWDNETDKPALVLLHGFGATTRFQWFKQVEMLSENYRLILPNLFHFGNSFPAGEKFKVTDQVDLVKTLVDDLKLEKFTLTGVSYGGLVSAEFANLHQERIEKLVIMDAPIKFMYASDIENVCKVFKVPSVEELFVPSKPKGLKKLWHLSSSKKTIMPAFLFKEFYDRMYSGSKENKRKLMTELLAGMDEYAKHEYNLSVPVLLVWGSNDMVVPAERGKMLDDYLGENSEFQVIFKGGHMVNLNKTKEFNVILNEFLLRK